MSDLWWFDSIFLSPACFPLGISDGRKIRFDRGVYVGLQNFTRKYHFLILDYLLYGVIWSSLIAGLDCGLDRWTGLLDWIAGLDSEERCQTSMQDCM